MTIAVTLPDGVKQIVYDPISRFTAVYYRTGAVDYFHGVAWTDFSAVASSATPLAVVSTTLTGKYKTNSGAHG